MRCSTPLKSKVIPGWISIIFLMSYPDLSDMKCHWPCIKEPASISDSLKVVTKYLSLPLFPFSHPDLSAREIYFMKKDSMRMKYTSSYMVE